MRNVVESREIAHLWAHQTQETARCSASMSFNGLKFFSYATCVAEIVKDKKTKQAIYVISEDTYSNTTARHLGHVRHAIPHGAPTFYVPGVRVGYDNLADPQRVLSAWRDEVMRKLEESNNARNPKKNRLWIEAGELVERMQQYAEAMHFAKAKTKKLLPKLPAKQELLAEWRKQIESANERREQKRLAKIREAEEDNLRRWLAGEVVHGIMPRDHIELRVNGQDVETSLGVRFPVKDARRGLALVDTVMVSNELWQANGKTLRLGPYYIDRIEPDGTVHAGCHIVKIEAINRVRDQIIGSRA